MTVRYSSWRESRTPTDNCGFEDVRLSDTGRYYCYKCGKDFGPDFGKIMRRQLPAETFEKFEKQLHL